MERQPRALVTGAAKRLGRAIALALARDGIDVVIHYRESAQEAEAVADAARGFGAQAWTVQADLGEPAQAESLFAKVLDLAGRIDLLVNNASIFPRSRLLDFTWAELYRNVQVNAFAPLVLCRAFADKQDQGTIINLLDSRIASFDRAHAAYHLSKQMLSSITRLLAVELAPGIRVNAVAPGLILPPPGEDDSYLERMKHTNLLGRHGSADQVADAVLFLVKSDFITGQVLYVDGGRHLDYNPAG